MIHPQYKLKTRLKLLAKVVDQIGAREMHRHLEKCRFDLYECSPSYARFTPECEPFLQKEIMKFFNDYADGRLDGVEDLSTALTDLALQVQGLIEARDAIAKNQKSDSSELPY